MRITEKHLHLWLPAYLRHRTKTLFAPRPKATRHLLFCICDHYEPLHGQGTVSGGAPVSAEAFDRGTERVGAWRTRYPELARRFRDSNGRSPRHTFFFPGEQYDPRLVEPLGEMCAMGLGEVEIHLHHDGDTRASLKASLEKTLSDLSQHGLVPRRPSGSAANGVGGSWAFIHGNWCLANARKDGRWCGVDDEMALLYELGCYADFTFPSAPDESQPGIVNAIYYPRGDVARRRAYEEGDFVRVGMAKRDRLLLIEGPLALARRPGSLRLRIENGNIDWADPPTAARLRTWVDQRVGVEGRPEWVFVKVHTHGAPERNAAVLLGEPMDRFHEALRRCDGGARWKLHYVTAREMYNVARAAMDGKSGSPAAYFDYEVPPPERARV
jgi:hypothetical protein